MASKVFTDEEIQEELVKLGHGNISEAVFQKLKSELNQIVLSEETSSPHPLSTTASSEKSAFINSEDVSSSFTSNSPLRRTTSDSFLRSNPRFSSERLPDFDKENSMSSRISVGPRIIKRKILRHINGERVIEEAIRVVPSVVNKHKSWDDDVKPSPSTTSFEDLFLRMRGLSLNSSSKSSSSKSSVILPNLNVIRRKNDPVTRYHQYRKYWDACKIPGETKHKQLRWTVRERMLDYDFS